MSNNKKRFPLFHVPHDGTTFPEELMESVCIPKEQFLSYHERMRDTGVLEMVPNAWRNSGNTLYFPVSRLLCDVERFPGPEEPMERLGMSGPMMGHGSRRFLPNCAGKRWSGITGIMRS